MVLTTVELDVYVVYTRMEFRPVAIFLYTKTPFTAETRQRLALDVKDLFGSVYMLEFFPGSNNTRFVTPPECVVPGFQKMLNRELSLPHLGSRVAKGMLRLPKEGEPLYKSGTRHVFKNSEKLKALIASVPKLLPSPNSTDLLPAPHDSFEFQSSCLLSNTLQQKLANLRTVNWGRASADPVPKFLVDVAQEALMLLEYDQEPNVSPSFEGEVDLTWHEPYLELAVSLDLDEFVFNRDCGPTQFCSWPSTENSSEKVNRWTQEVVKRVQPLLDEASAKRLD